MFAVIYDQQKSAIDLTEEITCRADKSVEKTTFIVVDIESMTGKVSGYTVD